MSEESEESEEIAWLLLPARPEYLSFARLTAASLATRLGFSYDDMEDLRLGVDEICFALLETVPRADADAADAGAAGPVLELRYSISPAAIEVEGAMRWGALASATLSNLGIRILSAVVDAYEVRQRDGQGGRIWMRKSAPQVTAG